MRCSRPKIRLRRPPLDIGQPAATLRRRDLGRQPTRRHADGSSEGVGCSIAALRRHPGDGHALAERLDAALESEPSAPGGERHPRLLDEQSTQRPLARSDVRGPVGDLPWDRRVGRQLVGDLAGAAVVRERQRWWVERERIVERVDDGRQQLPRPRAPGMARYPAQRGCDDIREGERAMASPGLGAGVCDEAGDPHRLAPRDGVRQLRRQPEPERLGHEHGEAARACVGRARLGPQ